MARKSVNFNVSEETYNRIHEIFPGVLGTDENLQLLIQAYDYWYNNKVDVGAVEALVSEKASLMQQLEEAQQKIASLSEKDTANLQEIDSLKGQLDSAIQNSNTTQSGNERLAQELKDLREQLTSALDQLKGEQEAVPSWEKIRKAIEKGYVVVVEEVTRRLKEKYSLPELDPMIVLVTFFLKYYYNQEVEFSGMPFVITPKEILSLIQEIHPEIQSNTLKQVLSVK